jgi:hypothetical protein
MSELTKAQRELLQEACEPQGAYAVESYRPATALVDKGFARWEHVGKHLGGTTRLHATDAGLRALQAQEAKE